MIEKIIKDKLSETKLMMSHARRNEIRKHLDYYSGVLQKNIYQLF